VSSSRQQPSCCVARAHATFSAFLYRRNPTQKPCDSSSTRQDFSSTCPSAIASFQARVGASQFQFLHPTSSIHTRRGPAAFRMAFRRSSAGVVPVRCGGASGWPVMHALTHSLLSPSGVQDTVRGKTLTEMPAIYSRHVTLRNALSAQLCKGRYRLAYLQAEARWKQRRDQTRC
jgi:hypothetical protein